MSIVPLNNTLSDIDARADHSLQSNIIKRNNSKDSNKSRGKSQTDMSSKPGNASGKSDVESQNDSDLSSSKLGSPFPMESDAVGINGDGNDSENNPGNRKEEEQLPFTNLDVNIKAREKRPTGNAITTTKYNWLTWLPISLWDQFRRIANAYFLFISILMLIGTYATFLFETPLDPYSTVGTLVVVLLITSVKELVEDRKRARSDQLENNRDVTVVTFTEDGKEELTNIKSKSVNPGDIIRLDGHMPCPVDLLLIVTSYHEDGNKCFIDTMNLDGETNLKVRTAPAGIGAAFPDIIQAGQAPLQLFNGNIEFEVPNGNMHKFVGTLRLSSSSDPITLNEGNIILRSSIFANTDWAYGIAVYTGRSTKIQINNKHAPSKLSRIEENANMAVIVIFFAQVLLVTMSVISLYALGFSRNSNVPYVYQDSSFFNRDDDDNGGGNSVLPLWLEQWIVFFLLYNNMIPISLYVTIEMVNLGQAFLLGADATLYHEELNVPCTVKSSNLCQELGMVSNIFSDKTGTLTRNEMKLVKFSIAGTINDVKPKSSHGPRATSAGDGRSKAAQQQQHEQQSSIARGSDAADVEVDFAPHNVTATVAVEEEDDWVLSSKEYMQRLGPNKQSFYEFFRCLTTCHTVIREKSGTYRAESPDELALIEGAGNYRCSLRERGSYDMTVEVFGERRAYDVLAVNKFDSDRKRMSVLLLDKVNNEYLLVCKGADNIMLPLCRITPAEQEKANQDLVEFSNVGLRTLVVAEKRLSEADARAWLKQFRAAEASTTDRARNVAAAGNAIEKHMKLLGITAIEDRLQDEVPEVIAECGRAGIIVWMLTGDKLETAISIGHSCNLLLHDTQLHKIVNQETKEQFADKLDAAYHAITKEPRNPNAALIIDGPSFASFVSSDIEQRRKLLAIGACSRSVISCRLTPTQKEQLVNLVKTDTKPKATCLSIGDGANDVPMIKAANVGVGIYGKEGRQAANNADFAIGEFKFLRKLLFVHGRWNYVRQSNVFLYSVHKNMVITLTLFWFSYFTAVSGTSLYESWVYTGFNFMLGLPIIFYGILDRDISADFAIAHPEVYASGRINTKLNLQAVCTWLLNAVLYAIVLCLMFFYALADTFEDAGLYVMGTIVFTGMVMSLQAKVAFLHNQWAWPQITMMAISVFGMLLYYLFVDVTFIDYYGVAFTVYGMGIFWLMSMFMVPLTVVMIDVFGYYTQLIFRPSQEMLYRELEHKDKFDGVNTMTSFHRSEPMGERESFASNKSYGGDNGVELRRVL